MHGACPRPGCRAATRETSVRSNAGELHTNGTGKHLAWRSNAGVGPVLRPPAAVKKYGAGNMPSVRTRLARLGSHLQAVKKCGVGIYFNSSPGRERANWEEIQSWDSNNAEKELDLQLQSIGQVSNLC
jgi:hypothetical protein